MKIVNRIFSVAYSIITVLFVFSAFSLIAFAMIELWHAISPLADVPLRARFSSILESIGLLTIAVAALELGQTILEEEVQRKTQISIPTRVRRFLSRFMIVIVVSLSIELLVAVFELIHEDPGRIPHVATIGIATAALLIAWGGFIHLNRSAEELEPEAIERVKEEDARVEEDTN